MIPFKFVHAADLHLDSAFQGIACTDERVAGLLRESTFGAFERTLDLCLERGAEFLLIAGDVYNSEDRSLRAQVRFRDGLKLLSDCGVSTFVVHGNHDPLDGWSAVLRWPERVHIFGGQGVESVQVEKEGKRIARIHGISYPTREVRSNLAREFRREDRQCFDIALLHCNLGGNPDHEPYAPCTEDDLVSADMNYWALGHQHTREVVSPEKPAIVYPGTSQGCSIKEPGAHGCYLVEVGADGHPSLTFVAVDTVRWFYETLPAEGIGDEGELVERADDLCRSLGERAEGRPVVCRIRLTGRGALHRLLSDPAFVEDLLRTVRDRQGGSDPSVWVEAIESSTSSPVDLDGRRDGQDFLGSLLRLADEYRESPELLDSLGRELAPLFQSRLGRTYLEPLTADEIKACLSAAETRCADMLAGDED